MCCGGSAIGAGAQAAGLRARDDRLADARAHAAGRIPKDAAPGAFAGPRNREPGRSFSSESSEPVMNFTADELHDADELADLILDFRQYLRALNNVLG